MVRPAPGAERTIAVLTFLADHPRGTFTLSELARHLDMNKATCHTVVTTLTDAGYLVRDPGRRTYTLGPALIGLGHAAAAQYDALAFARPEMEALAARLGLECLASVAAGDEIVVLARAGRPAPLGASAAPGQRLPLVPPLGTVFVAWSSPTVIDGWLARLGPDASVDARDRSRRAVAAVRARGYSVGLEADARIKLGQMLATLHDDTPDRSVRQAVEDLVAELGQEEYALVELGAARSYPVNHIAAPVFGSGGEVALALTLVGFPDDLAASQVPRFASELLGVTRRVTAAVRGREPAVQETA
jgi:DNA-binding IclR family transcriptional regulator